MNTTTAVQSLMKYVSSEHIKLQDLFNNSNLELTLPKDIFDNLVYLDSISRKPLLVRVNNKVIINQRWKSARWVDFLRYVKKRVRFSEDKFSVFACRFHKTEFYFFEFRGSSKKERLIYTI